LVTIQSASVADRIYRDWRELTTEIVISVGTGITVVDMIYRD